jgi:ribosomal protein S6E (S10)
MKMADNPLEPGPQDYDRINVLVESEVAYWSKELGVSREQLARAIEEVGERVVDVRRQLGLLGRHS